MPCMCGDYCCWSCGPAQGNWKCPICGEWASEGCKHIGVRSGKLLKRYEKQAARIAKAEADAEAKMAAEWEEYEKLHGEEGN
jgi:hypothetical protein